MEHVFFIQMLSKSHIICKSMKKKNCKKEIEKKITQCFSTIAVCRPEKKIKTAMLCTILFMNSLFFENIMSRGVVLGDIF